MISNLAQPYWFASLSQAISELTDDTPLSVVSQLAESTLTKQVPASGYLWAMESANGYLAICHKGEIYYAPMLAEPAANGAIFDLDCLSTFDDLHIEDERDAAKQIMEILKSPQNHYYFIKLEDGDLAACDLP